MRNKTQIIRQVIDNPEGGTVTASAYRTQLPDHGYFVGGNGEPFVADSVESMRQDVLRTWLDCAAARFIGWWTDSEDGKVYVDGTDWFASLDVAARFARERREVAFWDIAEKREIRLAYVDGE